LRGEQPRLWFVHRDEGAPDGCGGGTPDDVHELVIGEGAHEELLGGEVAGVPACPGCVGPAGARRWGFGTGDEVEEAVALEDDGYPVFPCEPVVALESIDGLDGEGEGVE